MAADRLAAVIAQIDALPLIGLYGTLIPVIEPLSISDRRALVTRLADRFAKEPSRMALPATVRTFYDATAMVTELPALTTGCMGYISIIV